MYMILSAYLKHCLTRTIFESPPLSLQAVCVATNVAGVDRKFFNIKLLRKADQLLFYPRIFSSIPLLFQHCQDPGDSIRGIPA